MHTQRWFSWARTALGGVLALALAGCSSLPAPPAQVVRYDLGPSPVAAANSAAGMALALGAMQAPLYADDSTALHYRLAYADGQVLQAYTQARWSVPPAQLVQQRLREHLSQGGRVVLSAEAGSMPPMVAGRQVPVLHLVLEEFSHWFTSAQDSVGSVRVRATLIYPARQGDVLMGQQVLQAQVPALQPQAAAGVQALAQAVDAIGQQLQAWLASQALPQ